jgi:glutathione S-transferase
MVFILDRELTGDFAGALFQEVPMSMVFYAAPRSSSSPVACALQELGVAHERVNVNLAAGEQRKPEYLALNPNGKVPLLVVDGTPLFEALAILQWLGDRYGVEKKLWPAADSPARLEALSWTTWGYVTFGYGLSRLFYASNERLPKEMHNAAAAAAAQSELQGLLGVLDARLGQRPYLLGSAFSLADLILASVINYGRVCGVPSDAHDHVTKWLERVLSRPSLQAPGA